MALAGKHPLRQARWLWPEAYFYLYNTYAYFRRDFELSAVPRRAPFYITADKAYKLFVNGEFVCRGPARGYQERWPFDEIDLAAWLRPGKNCLAIEAYNPGVSTFQYIHRAHAGLLCACGWPKGEIRTGDGKWLYCRSAAHNPRTARYSLQLDFQEDVDLSRGNRAWLFAPQAENEMKPWYPPDGVTGQFWTEIPFGRPPWEDLEPRGIPLLRESIVTPQQVTAHAEGQSADDYLNRENISWGWNREGRKIARWDDGAQVPSARQGDWLEIIIAPVERGHFRAITLDMGRMIVANLIVEADGAAGGEILDFQHDQCLRKGYPEFIPPGDACSIALANRLRLAPERNQHEFFHLLGFRHITIIARDVRQPLRLRLKARAAGYPFAMRGAFASSDETLNRIHAACRATQQLCALDAYVDTPWREQAQWWGDARVQARNTFYLDGDARLLARGIRSLAGQRTRQGLAQEVESFLGRKPADDAKDRQVGADFE
ncbi:MAG: hypothetical protein N3A66_04735, partial [Planctomycetota bacterium]|nr:hypothetical protein [Planctomycetota bacterium]